MSPSFEKKSRDQCEYSPDLLLLYVRGRGDIFNLAEGWEIVTDAKKKKWRGEDRRRFRGHCEKKDMKLFFSGDRRMLGKFLATAAEQGRRRDEMFTTAKEGMGMGMELNYCSPGGVRRDLDSRSEFRGILMPQVRELPKRTNPLFCSDFIFPLVLISGDFFVFSPVPIVETPIVHQVKYTKME